MVVAVVGVALAKPWDSAQTVPPNVSVVASLSPTPAPTETQQPTPTIDPQIDQALLLRICNAPPSWRLVSMETDVLGDSRTMFADNAAPASGPGDTQIPTEQLHASALYGVGVCRPNPTGNGTADLPFNSITIWSVDANGVATAIPDPTVLNESLYRLGEAYFGPPRQHWTDTDNATPTPPSWRPGRYVMQIAGAAPSGDSLWIALNFLAS
jgi:hypothetical protein